jgi:hypothetical protein
MFALPQALHASSSLGLWPYWSCLARHHQQQQRQQVHHVTANNDAITLFQAEMSNQLHKQ